MKKTTLFHFLTTLLLCNILVFSPCMAQSAQKAGKSVFKLTTFKSDGSILASTNGFFTGTKGEAVSAWTPFVGASRAVCIDADGQTHDVEAIYGANELYDVCRFRVSGATQALPLAKSNAASGSKLSLIGYSVKSASSKTYSVKSVETFGEQKYGYYILNEKAPENMANCPLVNKSGEVVGMLQLSKNDETHAVDARFVNAFTVKGLTLNDAVMQRTNIRTALPDNLDDARLTLLMAGEKNDSIRYVQYVGDFLRQFPTAIDGYTARAQQELQARLYENADATMQSALSNVADKAEAHSAYASLIYQKEIYMPDSTYQSWSLAKALEEAKTAYGISPLPVYQHQQAQILYSMGNFQEAYDLFLALTQTNIRNGELFYEAAQCRTNLGGTNNEVLALLDSAIAVNPESNISAPYYLARGRLLDEAGETRKAVQDYNKYDTLVYGRATHDFYYVKFKAESKIKQFQQALNDIAHAIVLNRAEPTYYAEMAALQLRVNQFEEAIRTADMCIAVQPEYSDPYIIKGIAQGELKQKAEALKTLQKAHELGDERAQDLIKKYK